MRRRTECLPQLGQRDPQAGPGRLVEHVGPEARGKPASRMRAGIERKVGQHRACPLRCWQSELGAFTRSWQPPASRTSNIAQLSSIGSLSRNRLRRIDAGRTVPERSPVRMAPCPFHAVVTYAFSPGGGHFRARRFHGDLPADPACAAADRVGVRGLGADLRALGTGRVGGGNRGRDRRPLREPRGSSSSSRSAKRPWWGRCSPASTASGRCCR